MIGAIAGWLLGAILSILIVVAIPGDQGILAFFIGFACGFLGFTLGGMLDRKRV